MTRLVLLAGALVLSGCVAPARAAFKPSIAPTSCPAAVEAAFITPLTCGYLTVLEDRTKPTGRTLHLLYIRVPPASGTVLPGLMTSFGSDSGNDSVPDGDAATQAVRLHHVDIRLEVRGAGEQASPSLRCPETDQLGTRAVNAPTGDPALTRAFTAAVSACARRLRKSGADLAAYDAQSQAADVEDLRAALGVQSWAVVGTWGTQSRALYDYVQQLPNRAAVAFADSPTVPGAEELLGGVAATRSAIAAFLEGCSSQPVCSRAHPRLADDWQRALTRLNHVPLTGRGIDAAGHLVPVRVDGGRLLRTARSLLGGDGPGHVGDLAGIISGAAAGRLTPELARFVARDSLFCAGYLPKCEPNFSLGSYLSTFCRDDLPLLDVNALTSAVAGDPAYASLFLHDPYVAACAAWQVPPSAAASRVLSTPVPMLFIAGALDSYTTADGLQGAIARMPHAWLITAPGQTHNVLGFSDCIIAARNAWVTSPLRPPPRSPCPG